MSLPPLNLARRAFSSVRRKARRAFSLWRRARLVPRDEKLLLLEAAWRLTWVAPTVRLLGWQRTAALLEARVLATKARDDAEANDDAKAINAGDFAELRVLAEPGIASRCEYSRAAPTARLIYAAARRHPLRRVLRIDCLPRALVLQAMLRQRGFSPQLILGVPRDATTSAFEAHAWIEIDGRAFHEDEDARVRFAAFEPRATPSNKTPQNIDAATPANKPS